MCPPINIVQLFEKHVNPNNYCIQITRVLKKQRTYHVRCLSSCFESKVSVYLSIDSINQMRLF